MRTGMRYAQKRFDEHHPEDCLVLKVGLGHSRDGRERAIEQLGKAFDTVEETNEAVMILVVP